MGQFEAQKKLYLAEKDYISEDNRVEMPGLEVWAVLNFDAPDMWASTAESIKVKDLKQRLWVDLYIDIISSKFEFDSSKHVHTLIDFALISN